jgi:beta-barrel assembly-enhancing protease
MKNLMQSILLLIALTLTSSCKMTMQNIDLGRLVDVGKGLTTQGEIGLEEEMLLGDQMTAVLLGAVPLHPDKQLQQYVNKVGRWVAQQSERSLLHWNFAVVDSTDLNAFAMPGGYVLITKGLLQNLHSESELAAVLAHEIAHVMQKHHLKEIERQNSVALMSNLAMVASDVYQAKQDSKGRSVDYLKDKQITERLLGATHELYTKGLRKEDEFEADRIGLVLAARADYDIYGLAVVMQTLSAIDPGDSHMALLFATHPQPTERLETMQPYINKLEQQSINGKMAQQRFALNTQAL